MLRTILHWILWLDIQLVLPFSLLHEACHYFAARAFGYRTKFSAHAVTVYGTAKPWHILLITLAPAIAGLPLAILFLVLHHQGYSAWLVGTLVGFFFWWEVKCGMDFAMVIHFLLFRRWLALPPRFQDKPFAPLHSLLIPGPSSMPFRHKKTRQSWTRLALRSHLDYSN